MISSLLERLLARVEVRTLLVMLVAAAALWGFAGLASEVMEGELQAFDPAILLALRTPGDLADPIGPPALLQAMRDITALGGVTWLVWLSTLVVVGLALRGLRRQSLHLAVAVAGGQLLSHLAKHAFARPRPDLVPHLAEVSSSSFPSGHSMMATATYLTLAVMIARMEPRPRMRIYYIAVAALMSVAVGVSRVFLGVHWPSDVLAGWMVGAAWALGCALTAQWLGQPHRASAKNTVSQAGSSRSGDRPERGDAA